MSWSSKGPRLKLILLFQLELPSYDFVFVLLISPKKVVSLFAASVVTIRS